MSNILDLVVPSDPYNKVEKVLVMSDERVTKDGDAEVMMDHQVQGKYAGVCRLLSKHSNSTLDAKSGDLVIIWDNAIKPFELPNGSGELLLIKDADIFAIVPEELSQDFISKMSSQ